MNVKQCNRLPQYLTRIAMLAMLTLCPACVSYSESAALHCARKAHPHDHFVAPAYYPGEPTCYGYYPTVWSAWPEIWSTPLGEEHVEDLGREELRRPMETRPLEEAPDETSLPEQDAER